MSKHYNFWFEQQPKVVAYRATRPSDPTAWLAAAAVAAAGILYLFGFFFSFTGGRLPAGN